MWGNRHFIVALKAPTSKSFPATCLFTSGLSEYKSSFPCDSNEHVKILCTWMHTKALAVPLFPVWRRTTAPIMETCLLCHVHLDLLYSCCTLLGYIVNAKYRILFPLHICLICCTPQHWCHNSSWLVTDFSAGKLFLQPLRVHLRTHYTMLHRSLLWVCTHRKCKPCYNTVNHPLH